MRIFNTKEAAKFTGIPVDILIRMRSDSTRGEDRRGPPHRRLVTQEGAYYRYSEKELIEWMQTRNIMLTANDCAFILEISRTKVLKLFGLHRQKVGNGEIVIHSAKNFFLYITKKQLKLKKLKGKR